MEQTRSVTCAPRRLPNVTRKMSDYNHVVFPRKLLKKFILLYKELSCLWDREVPDYRIKMKKHAALSKLTELVQEYDPNATRVHVLRKIDSLRACVRREYKRVQESRQHATCEDEVYKPNLWYYDLFSFVFKENADDNDTSVVLDENATATVSIKESRAEAEDEDEDDQSEDDHHDSYDAEPYPAEFNIPLSVVEINDRASSSRKHQSPNVNDGDPYRNKRAKASTEVDDEYDAIGINVAAKLRFLPATMRILAEKLINDVLFQAQTNGLNSSTKIITMDPFKQESSSA